MTAETVRTIHCVFPNPKCSMVLSSVARCDFDPTGLSRDPCHLVIPAAGVPMVRVWLGGEGPSRHTRLWTGLKSMLGRVHIVCFPL